MLNFDYVFSSVLSMLVSRRHDQEEGATAVEYALVIGLVSIVVVGAVALFGDNIKSFVSTVTFK